MPVTKRRNFYRVGKDYHVRHEWAEFHDCTTWLEFTNGRELYGTSIVNQWMLYAGKSCQGRSNTLRFYYNNRDCFNSAAEAFHATRRRIVRKRVQLEQELTELKAAYEAACLEEIPNN